MKKSRNNMENVEGFRIYRLWCSIVNYNYGLFIGLSIILPLFMWKNGQEIVGSEIMKLIGWCIIGCVVTFVVWLFLFGLNMLFPKRLVAIVSKEGIWVNDFHFLFRNIKEVRYHTNFPSKHNLKGHCSLYIRLNSVEKITIDYAPRILEYYLLCKCHAKWKPDKGLWLVIGITIVLLIIFLIFGPNSHR